MSSCELWAVSKQVVTHFKLGIAPHVYHTAVGHRDEVFEQLAEALPPGEWTRFNSGQFSSLPSSIKTSPYLQAQKRSDPITQEACIRLQGINEEVGIFCGLVEVLVLSEVEVLQAGQGHYTGPTRQASASLLLFAPCVFVGDPASPNTQ